MNIFPPQFVKKAMSNPKVAEFAENTVYAVSIETCLKMVGRPTFIYADKKADPESKKYASVKEFLYQGTCLGLYLSIVPLIKKGLYNLISGHLRSKSEHNEADIDVFNKAAHAIDDAHKLKNKNLAKELTEKFKSNIKTNKQFHLGKGAKELSAIIGSILTLTVIAPQLSHYIVHPAMKVLGFDKEPTVKKQTEPAK